MLFCTISTSPALLLVRPFLGSLCRLSVVTANQRTFHLVEEALVASGLPASAINLAPVPSTLGLLDDIIHVGGQIRLGTHFEVLMRLFRFHNQTEGDAYLHSYPPVYYLRGTHGDDTFLPSSKAPGYRSRAHPESVDEAPLSVAFASYGRDILTRIESALLYEHVPSPTRRLTVLVALSFAPLKIIGLECLRQRTKCLGDGPDAAYFAPNVHEMHDEMELMRLQSDDELHIVVICHHRSLNASVYGSIAMVKPSSRSARTLSKSFMTVRATSLGVTSFDFGMEPTPFVAWAFTRNPRHCSQLNGVVHGCSIVWDEQVPRDGYLTYCERVYLNPASGLGPDWDKLLPARLYHVRLAN